LSAASLPAAPPAQVSRAHSIPKDIDVDPASLALAADPAAPGRLYLEFDVRCDVPVEVRVVFLSLLTTPIQPRMLCRLPRSPLRHVFSPAAQRQRFSQAALARGAVPWAVSRAPDAAPGAGGGEFLDVTLCTMEELTHRPSRAVLSEGLDAGGGGGGGARRAAPGTASAAAARPPPPPPARGAAGRLVGAALGRAGGPPLPPPPHGSLVPVAVILRALSAGTGEPAAPEKLHVTLAALTYSAAADARGEGPAGGWGVAVLQQRIQVAGCVYVLKTLFGDEPQPAAAPAAADAAAGGGGGGGGSGAPPPAAGGAAAAAAEGAASGAPSGSECVICLTEPKTTAILPCRHLCLFAECAEALRFQSNRCPVCRAPVSSFLDMGARTK